MRIIQVAPHACIRVLKQAIGLQFLGHEVVLLSKIVANAEIRGMYPPIMMWENRHDLGLKLDIALGNCDPSETVVHVHNEPSWPGWFAKAHLMSNGCETPVVFDCHDLNAMRFGVSEVHESESIANVDAVVTPSKAYAEGVRMFFGVDAGKPVETVYSAMPAAWCMSETFPYVGGCCYEGGVSSAEGSYSDYRDIAEHLQKNGVPLYVYSARSHEARNYYDFGTIFQEKVPYQNLLQSLGRHKWGLCGPGSMDKSTQWDRAMPNKLFEYLACGLPILTWGASEVAEFVRAHDCGMVLETWKDIPMAYHTIPTPVMDGKRMLVTAEGEAMKLDALYRRLLGKEEGAA